MKIMDSVAEVVERTQRLSILRVIRIGFIGRWSLS